MADRTVRVRLEAAVAGFTAAMAQAQASTRAFGSRFGRMARENSEMMRTMGTVAMVAGGTVVAGFGKAVGAAANFEAEMNRVGALTGATGEAFDSLSAQAQELGRTTMFSASEAAQGMGYLAMAGFDTQEILSAMPSTLDLAAAGQLDLAQAADIASNVLTGYGKEASEVGEVNDVIAATATSANTSVDQMGQAMSMVAPIANSSGLAFEETAAAIGMLGDAGIQGTRAGTTLRQMLASLESPTGPAAAAIEDLGLKTHDSAGNLRSLEDIIGQLEEQGASTGEVMEIFGNRAGPGLAALMDMGSDSLREMTGELENSQGAAKEMAERQLEGLKGAMTELASAGEGMAIAFGSVLTPALESAADGLNTVFTNLAELPRPAQQAVSWVGGLGGAALTAGGGFLFMAPRIVETKDALRNMGPMAQRTARGMSALGKGVGIGAVVWAADAALSELDKTLTDMTRGAIPAVEDLTLAFQGLAEQGQLPESVAGSLDGVGEAIERADAGGLQGLADGFARVAENVPGARFMPGIGEDIREVERLDEGMENLGGALAQLVDDGNANSLNAALDELGLTVEEAREKFPKLAKAMDQADLSQEGVTESAGPAAEGIAEVDEAAEEATSTIDAYTEATQSMIGVHLDAASAEIAFMDAIDKVSASAKENETTLDLNSDAGRRNREAIIGAADAAIDHAGKLIEEGASADEATAALSGHIGNLKEEMSQAGYTEAQISSLIDEYNLTPDQILTEIIAETGDAESKLARFRSQVNSLNGRRVTVFMDTQYGRTVAVPGGGRIIEGGGVGQHAGGWAGKGKPRRMHGGGLAPDEVGPVVLQRGEYVVRREMARAYGPLLEAINAGRMHGGGPVAMASSAPAPQVSVSAGGMPGSVTLVDVNGSILAQAEVIADGVARSHRAASARGRRMREGAV